MTQDTKICVGVIIGVHGITGDVRLRSFTAEPDAIGDYGILHDKAGERSFKIKIKGIVRDAFIAKIEGVRTRDAAEDLVGTEFYVAREILPATKAREYYECDLLQMQVRDGAGQGIGKISGVHDYGAGSFLEITPDGGRSFMLPFTDACVPEVNMKDGFVTITPPDGWVESKEKKADSNKRQGDKQ